MPILSPRKYPYVSGAVYGVVVFGAAIALMFGGITCTAVAGDLLRGGYTTSQGASGAPGSATPASVLQERQNAQDVLARTTMAIDAVASMQKAARKLAGNGANNLGINPNMPGQTLPAVPNGLGVGGLAPSSIAWSGASAPTQSTTSNGQTVVTIDQSAADAYLYWTTFNIGKDTTLDIDQSKGGKNVDTWIAFNFVADPSGIPSQILGSIHAPGQVYVINQNGIIFGGSSQVNVHTLVASSLPINTYLIQNGLLNNPDDQFLFSAISQPAGTSGSPAFTPPASFAPGGEDGEVIVQPGAQIVVPANAASVGGRVALIGPEVDNEGLISTPDGQTILAAGLQVAFVQSSDATLRGLDAFVGAVSDSANPNAGVVTNGGLISVPSGDAYMTGETVNQLGVIASTTSVTLNGRIDLLADYNTVSSGGQANENPYLPKASGAVVLGPESVTQILPDLESSDTVTLSGFTLSSEVNIQGKTIHMEGNSTLLAPSASISVDAGTWNFVILGGNSASDNFVNTVGQIYLDSGAIIDAAGSADVQASVAQNIVSAQLLGPELADSPTQRDGVFVGQTINVDIRDTGVYNGMAWVGTPLADVSGYVGLIPYTVGELTINGGLVNLAAGGSVVMQPGSEVNVAGGWIDYQGGVVSTSEVISDGHIYPISEADPDLVYQGFNLGTFTVNHPTYGISQTYTDPILDVSHYENSYVNGGNGGVLNIIAPAVALDGEMVGTTVVGPRQLSISPTPNSLTSSSFPTPSVLSLAFEQQEGSGSNILEFSPTPPHVIFSPDTTLPTVAPFAVDGSGNPVSLPTAREDEVVLSPDLFTSNGFGSLKVNDSDGDVTVPAGVTLDAGADGSITISAANLDVEGSILAPEGSLSFTVYDFSPFATLGSTAPAVNPDRGHFVLGPDGTLSTAGLIVDDREGAAAPDTVPLATSGGTITIASFSADLSAGSVIDVSGGVEMTTSGKPSYGNAGKITIATGNDPAITALIGGSLTLDSELEGYSGAKGGSLSIQAELVQIGGAASHPDTLVIAPDFFSDGGFSSFSLSGLGGLTSQTYGFLPGLVIAPGTEIDPVATSYIAVPDIAGDQIQLVETLLPLGVRSPVSLTLKAPGVSTKGFSYSLPFLIRGDLVMGAGSVIRTDPGGSVTLNGQTTAVLGSIYAPGGTISIDGATNSTTLFASDTEVPTVDIGPGSVLSTAGTTVLTANARGYRTGSVLNGGAITLNGNIVAEAGSVLDVSGASSTLDLTPVQANVSATPGGQEAVQNGSFLGIALVPTEVDSNGGSINLVGAQELFTDATLLGAAGGPSAIGGSLSISSGRGSGTVEATFPTLIVTQGGLTIPVAFYSAGQNGIGHSVVNKQGNAIAPMGYIAANAFGSGGFDSLDLAGTVQFSGPVSISVPGSITVATAGVLYANAAVTLTANSVTLGQPFIPPIPALNQQDPFTIGAAPYHFDPTYGTGSLTVKANLIDIGTLSLQDIGSANFIADGGSIQGDGTLDVQGSISMRAGQVYVPTEVSFTIAAYDYTANGQTQAGSIQFFGAGEQEVPLSAGGDLNVYATTINQDGVLRAPLGSINLGWNGSGTVPVDEITGGAVDVTQNLTLGKGSVTSVAAIDAGTGQPVIIPYGTNPNGNAWIDPSGVNITAGGVPQKSITVSAVNVNDQKGAVLDIKGGGDLFTYQFVPGIGGNNDILGSTTSFAIIPGYQANYAPYDTDAGYNNAGLVPGDRIYLNASAGLAAGYYTLLPARYALLPGAFLVTPQSGLPAGASQILPDGGSLVSGYRTAAGETAAPVTTSFEVDSGAVINTLAQYTEYSGNTFFAHGAIENNQKVPRLPQDSGELSFQAVDSLAIAGIVESTPLDGGLGGLVDIASPDNIVITGASGATQSAGTLVLNAGELSSFGAASLLIGGTRQTGANGVTVDVTTANITVDNSGDPLTGADIILACTDTLTVAPDAEIEASGAESGAEAITVAGNGALLRVSSDPNAAVTRTGVTSATQPELAIGAGAKITGGAVTLDSSSGTSLDPNAVIKAKSVALNSGQITIELTDPGTVAATTGLVLSGNALSGLFGSAESVSLLSYSSIDIYGSGQIGTIGKSGEAVLGNLTLSAGEIRGFNNGGGSVAFDSRNILIENAAAGSDPGATAAAGGTLTFNADTIALGANALAIDQFATVDLDSTIGMMADATNGTVAVQGDLNLSAPMITGVAGAGQTISAGGALTITAPAKAPSSPLTGGLGANLAFVGASVTDNSAIAAHSGSITLHATTGDVTIGNAANASLDVSGQSKAFFDATGYTNGGEIDLIADQGNVSAGSNNAVTTTIDVSAQSGGGNAGTLTVSARNGTLSLGGNLSATGGVGGQSGSFSLDAGTLTSLSELDASLNKGVFDQSRTIEVDTGDVLVDGLAATANFSLSADAGSITVSGEIDGSGETGGTITLQAEGSVTLLSGAVLTVAAENFSDAQKGGSVDLEAGSDVNGVASSTAVVDIQNGSTIDLSVANAKPAPGDLTGTLLIRAPQMAGNTDLQVNAINGTITGASSITVEGYEIFNAAGSGGSIDAEEGAVNANGKTFAGNTQAITNRLLANNAGLAPVLIVEPGAEIINPAGDLTLSNTWDLSTYRFGPDSVPGQLTLRAAGNIVLEYGASLTDGFDVSQSADGLQWDAPLLPTVGALSWSYRLVAGADFSGANFADLTPLEALPGGSGSLLLGLGAPALPSEQAGSSNAVPSYFQTIRTGAGSIQIYAGRDVQLLNNLATIYSAGTQAPPLSVFNTPDTSYFSTSLGPAPLNFYPAQFTEYGGSVTVEAQNDIAHYVDNGSAQLVADSSLELPINWLDRQGEIDPMSGAFAAPGLNGQVESTAWWVNFSNYFEGVATFGGGNVSLKAGNDIVNVDAAVATNAAMNSLVPDASAMVELGGGDLTVNAGANINGGVYYVERGLGTINAGGQILTNSTRATITQALATIYRTENVIPNSSTWLPTALFAGDASFDVSAGGNVLLGPVANPFLLPQSIYNSFFERSFFSTYAPNDQVDVESLAGNVTVKDSTDSGEGSLAAWLNEIDSQHQTPTSFAGLSQTWLAIAQPSTSEFDAVVGLMAPTLRVTAFSGSINLVGSIILSPAPDGTVDLLAAGSINGFQINGYDFSLNLPEFGSSIIDLSDADPAAIPSITSPIFGDNFPIEVANPFTQIDIALNETGSTIGAAGTIQTKEALHTEGLLHVGDSEPVHLYAASGDLSGVTLYSGKFSRVIAGQDITDASFYIQNVSASDISVVSADRDIIPYDPTSPLRLEVQDAGDEFYGGSSAGASASSFVISGPASGAPTAGDIQISGPGTLEVLAGRNFMAGLGSVNPDGTAAGITSIGNGRDPYLPFAGAQIVVAAGLGGVADGLSASSLNITAFVSQVLEGTDGAAYFADLAPAEPGLDVTSIDEFKKLPAPQQAIAALDLFYLVLRDAGRNHNLIGNPGYGNYDAGIAAIRALLPNFGSGVGDIDLTSKELTTESGGDIDIIDPSGALTVGINLAGVQPVDQGIFTDAGGNVSIYTEGSVNLGTSRIFTLQGGNIIIWSNAGDIDAGNSSKTVQSAPPTRVVVDPQSANVETDLSGLATGGGIGVLATVAGVPPGNVDLIAPSGVIDAGDAGIRATGNLNLAAVQILNASNIQVGGASSGVPTVVVAAPNLAGLSAASSAAGATTAAANQQVNSQNAQSGATEQTPDSIINVEVLGYGGGDPGDAGG